MIQNNKEINYLKEFCQREKCKKRFCIAYEDMWNNIIKKSGYWYGKPELGKY